MSSCVVHLLSVLLFAGVRSLERRADELVPVESGQAERFRNLSEFCSPLVCCVGPASSAASA